MPMIDRTNQIYLEGCLDSDDEFLCNVETYITLYCIKYMEPLSIDVILINNKKEQETESWMPLKNDAGLLPSLCVKNVAPSEVPKAVNDCRLPCGVEDNGTVLYSGLCTVLRFIVSSKEKSSSKAIMHGLLGYKGNCLKACAHLSTWTTFCEVELPNFLREMCGPQKTDVQSLTVLPDCLFKLENNFKLPVVAYNIRKRLADFRKQQTLIKGIPCNISELPHLYIEGVDMYLTDVITYSCLNYYLNRHDSVVGIIKHHLPKVFDWYIRMSKLPGIVKGNSGLNLKTFAQDHLTCESSKTDLSEKDMQHTEIREAAPAKLNLTIEEMRPIIDGLGPSLQPEPSVDLSTNDDHTIDWENIPNAVHPRSGDLPKKRLERKCQQLESLVCAIHRIAKTNDVIVDFCSGGGHLGILLSYYLPNCHIILIENKEESVMRAKKRVLELKSKNVTIYQCNLEHYHGAFNIGTCLHACGVATDMVMEKSIEKQASFVICPCCYGGVKDTLSITFPRSSIFRNSHLPAKDYITIGHVADQTEKYLPNLEQGRYCMDVIDTDRSYYAQEKGYTVKRTLLKPETCSPKNNVLVGVIESSS